MLRAEPGLGLFPRPEEDCCVAGLGLQTASIQKPDTTPLLRNLRDSAAEVARNRLLLTLIVVTAVVEVFGVSFLTLVPSLAQDRLALGAQGMGWMQAVQSAGGLLAGLSNEDAARYGFLLATPIIGAAAILKLPDLFGPAGDGIRGQALVGALCSAVTAYIAVKFLMRFFETKRLTPFAGYCLAAGVAASIYFALQ